VRLWPAHRWPPERIALLIESIINRTRRCPMERSLFTPRQFAKLMDELRIIAPAVGREIA